MTLVIDLALTVSFMFLTYFITIFALRKINDKKQDRELAIKTTRVGKAKKGTLNNRSESTPYSALETLIKNYKFSKNDKLVDFGMGSGRVIFFFNNYLDMQTTGVEFDKRAIKEVEENLDKYLENNNLKKSNNIKIENCLAEEYKIKEDENLFYFFNPFKWEIFEKVVNNIIAHSNETNKEVTIILYYPTQKYKEYLQNNTNFKLFEKIVFKGAINPLEKFLIYKLNLMWKTLYWYLYMYEQI